MTVNPAQPLPIPLDASSVKAGMAAGEGQRCWLDYRHPEWDTHHTRWEFALDHYTGEILDPSKVRRYLLKKTSGESDAQYDERVKGADYTTHFAFIVDSLVGMICHVENDANRTFTKEGVLGGLGATDDPSTPIGKLWRSADPDGNSYLTVFKRLAILLTVVHRAWLFVDPANGSPLYHVFSPVDVVNWVYDENGLAEVLILEQSDVRTSLVQAPGTEPRYLHVTREGWQRYRKDADGNAVKIGEGGTWTFESPDRVSALPIFPVLLPMLRMVGWLMAKKANAIFNAESALDNLIRTGNFPKLVLAAGNELYDKTIESLQAGSNVLQEPPAEGGKGHRYIGPPSDNATVAGGRLTEKRKDFYVTAYREYGDAAAQKTATEVRQDVASGAGAFLQLLKSALDDAENNALWRTEQSLWPTDRRKWFIAHTERSDRFTPADPEAVLQAGTDAAFGKDKPVPLGKLGRVAIAKQLAEYRGIEVDEAEIEAEVTVRMILDTMATATDITLPAEVRADLAMALLASAGLLDAEAVVTLEDGQKVSRLKLMRQQALDLAMAADEAKKRLAESMIGGPPDGSAGGGAPGSNTGSSAGSPTDQPPAPPTA